MSYWLPTLKDDEDRAAITAIANYIVAVASKVGAAPTALAHQTPLQNTPALGNNKGGGVNDAEIERLYCGLSCVLC